MLPLRQASNVSVLTGAFGEGSKGRMTSTAGLTALSRFEDRARRMSQESMLQKPINMSAGHHEPDVGFQIGQYLTKVKVQLQNRWMSNDNRSLKEQEVDTLAAIIRMYRGIGEDEDKDEDRVLPDRGAFQIGMSVIVVLNAIAIGLELEFEGTATNDRALPWIVVEGVFCLAFVIEVALKLAYHGWRWTLANSGKNLLTLLITLFALVDAALLHPLGIYGYLRLFTLLRIVGLLGLRKTFARLHVMEELRLVLDGLRESFVTIVWIVVLLTFFLYMCAVFVTEQVGHNEDYVHYRKASGGWDAEEYFGTIGRSMFTLLQMLTLDDWSSKIARHVINNQVEMSLFFILFIGFSTFGLLNILISIIVEHMLQAAYKNDKKSRLRLEVSRKAELESIKEVFILSDVDGSGEVDLQEFLEATKNPEVQWRMSQLGVPLTGAAKLFAVIDGDGSRTLTIQEFISGCKKLKGIAQSKDLLTIQAQADGLSHKMEALARSLEDTERMMGILDAITLRTDRRFPLAVEGARRKVARTMGGMKPMVPVSNVPKKDLTLATGNRPVLPQFPALLR